MLLLALYCPVTVAGFKTHSLFAESVKPIADKLLFTFIYVYVISSVFSVPFMARQEKTAGSVPLELV